MAANGVALPPATSSSRPTASARPSAPAMATSSRCGSAWPSQGSARSALVLAASAGRGRRGQAGRRERLSEHRGARSSPTQAEAAPTPQRERRYRRGARGGEPRPRKSVVVASTGPGRCAAPPFADAGRADVRRGEARGDRIAVLIAWPGGDGSDRLLDCDDRRRQRAARPLDRHAAGHGALRRRSPLARTASPASSRRPRARPCHRRPRDARALPSSARRSTRRRRRRPPSTSSGSRARISPCPLKRLAERDGRHYYGAASSDDLGTVLHAVDQRSSSEHGRWSTWTAARPGDRIRLEASLPGAKSHEHHASPRPRSASGGPSPHASPLGRSSIDHPRPALSWRCGRASRSLPCWSPPEKGAWLKSRLKPHVAPAARARRPPRSGAARYRGASLRATEATFGHMSRGAMSGA